MNFIVLLKQVPDVTKIPPDAWDQDKGTLKRNVLDVVLNPLDLHALTLACRMRDKCLEGSKVVCLTMGPPTASETIFDALARGADQGVLLTDAQFAGADTVATAYSLAMAIRKIEHDIFRGDKNYVVVGGVQSTDGDTAQVPPQIAEELDADLIAYVVDVEHASPCRFKRIGPAGSEMASPQHYPVVITATDCTDPLYPSFELARRRHTQKDACLIWKADDVQSDKSRIGFSGSMTQVVSIFSSQHGQGKECVLVPEPDDLLDQITERLKSVGHLNGDGVHMNYRLGSKTPTRRGEVWVFVEIHEGALAPVTVELIGKARNLADSLNEKVAAVLIGKDVRALALDLIAYGADKVYLLEHPGLENFSSSIYTRVLSELVKQQQPQIMLFGATPLGRELGPRVSYATGSGLTADCTKLEIGDYKDQIGVLLQTRPALGGNIMATIVTKIPAIQMATVRPGVFRYPPRDLARTGDLVECPTSVPASRVVMTPGEALGPKTVLSTAELIVSGGAGLRNAENFKQYIVPLAKQLGDYFQLKAEFGASRRAVEMGLAGRDHQVGQTGQTVEPQVYFAIGISGAIQHISGMQKSGIMVAVNPDPTAPVFKLADLGIIGKAEHVVPKLIECVARRKIRDGK